MGTCYGLKWLLFYVSECGPCVANICFGASHDFAMASIIKFVHAFDVNKITKLHVRN
jgi:hypothetical protein